MQSVSLSRLVPEPPDVVWGRLGDFAAISAWTGQVSHSTALTPRADGPGAVRRVQVGRNALRERVLDWQPGRRLSYTVEGLPKVVLRVVTTWTLVPEDAGTRVTVGSEVTTRPPFLARVVGRRVAAANAQLLADLAASFPATEVPR